MYGRFSVIFVLLCWFCTFCLMIQFVDTLVFVLFLLLVFRFMELTNFFENMQLFCLGLWVVIFQHQDIDCHWSSQLFLKADIWDITLMQKQIKCKMAIQSLWKCTLLYSIPWWAALDWWLVSGDQLILAIAIDPFMCDEWMFHCHKQPSRYSGILILVNCSSYYIFRRQRTTPAPI